MNPREEKKMQMQIAPQTKVAFVGYMLLIVAQVIYIVSNPQAGMRYLPNVIGFALVSLLGLYVVNCTVYGKCNIYAWVMGYLLAAFGIAAVSMVVYKMMV